MSKTDALPDNSSPPPARSGFAGLLDRYFYVSARGSTLAAEIRGGFATFFTMAYIVVLNPIIIATVPDATGQFLGDGSEPNLPLVAAATAFVAGVLSILMGLVGRAPFALAAGLGLNAFVAYSIASQMSWEDAMGLVVLEGLIILLLVVTGFRVAVFRAIPAELKTAISVGIGLFIALIGFVDAGFVRRTPSGSVPVQLGAAGTGTLSGWPTLVFVLGVLTIAFLVTRRVKGAILIGILGATVLAVIIEALADLGPQVVNGETVNPDAWSLTSPEIPQTFLGIPTCRCSASSASSAASRRSAWWRPCCWCSR